LSYGEAEHHVRNLGQTEEMSVLRGNREAKREEGRGKDPNSLCKGTSS
jgi:hypothetical protein